MTTTHTLVPYIDRPNKNGRQYDDEAIDKIVAEFNTRETPMYGQMGFPESPIQITSNASHEVTKIWKDGTQLMGEVAVFDNHDGKILQKLIEAKQVVFRSRSAGTIAEDGTVNIHALYSFDAIPTDNDAFKTEINDTRR